MKSIQADLQSLLGFFSFLFPEHPPIAGGAEQSHPRDPAADPRGPETGHGSAQPGGERADGGVRRSGLPISATC